MLNWLAVGVASLAGFVLGGLWYGPLFLKPWLRASGMTMERGREQNTLQVFGLAWLANFIAAAGLGLFIGPHHGALFGAHLGLLCGFVFTATSLAVVYLFESRPLQHWLINAGYLLVNFAAMGAILGAWPVPG
jgi:hypothetical protein